MVLTTTLALSTKLLLRNQPHQVSHSSTCIATIDFGTMLTHISESELADGKRPSVKKGTDEVDESSVGVGSIAAGGRYDELVGMFSGTNKKGEPNLKIPCVGISIGVERVFSILLAKQKIEDIKSNEVQVLVASMSGLLPERMQLARELWDADIKASYMFKVKPKLQKQFEMCDKDQIPLCVIIGEDELAKGEVKIKDMTSKDPSQAGGVTVKRSDMTQYIKDYLERK